MEGFEVRISHSKKVWCIIKFAKCCQVCQQTLTKTTSFQGKGLFATKMYEPGDIILEEDPLVSCQFAWNAAYRYLACDYCMR